MNFKLHDIDIEITQKKIKNLHLRVRPPMGSVMISAPKRMSIEKIHEFVFSKLNWINKHRKKMLEKKYEARKEYVDGETHYFDGKSFLLKIIEHQEKQDVILSHPNLIIQIRSGANKIKKQAMLDNWYRQQLNEKVVSLISEWEKKMLVSVSQFKIRKMKTRWGSCSPRSRSIRINLELAKRSLACIEYVVVHELVHLLEASHNKRFIALMDQFLPTWRLCRKELNSALIWRS